MEGKYGMDSKDWVKTTSQKIGFATIWVVTVIYIIYFFINNDSSVDRYGNDMLFYFPILMSIITGFSRNSVIYGILSIFIIMFSDCIFIPLFLGQATLYELAKGGDYGFNWAILISIGGSFYYALFHFGIMLIWRFINYIRDVVFKKMDKKI